MIKTTTFTYRNKQITYEQLKNHSMLPVEVECDNCHKSFTSTKYQLTRNGHQLCQSCAIRSKSALSFEVGTQFGNLTIIGKGHDYGYSLCKCACGTIKEFENRALKFSGTKSCCCLRINHGRSMMNELNNNRKRENHPRWKGGISSERDCYEKTAKYKQFKQSVLSSYNNTCQKCGSTSDINIHHFVPFSESKELRMDANNVGCLCESCHRLFHHIYGKKHNTKEQFEQFISS